MKCDELPPLNFSTYIIPSWLRSGPLLFDDQITFSCNTGFVIKDEDNSRALMTCDTDGSWQPANLTCWRKLPLRYLPDISQMPRQIPLICLLVNVPSRYYL